jgi:serine/threonine-protein kinase
MTPERWQQIDHLFHATLACEPAKRDDFLARACDGDEPLRREVESLISFHQECQSFIETPAGDVAAELLGTYESKFESGQQIDNYKIVSELGSGGMGEVYLADDLTLHRKIALKLLPQQFTIDGERVRRFEQEACAASALNHPNIVTIYEIGQSNSAHFIATEFIDGVTLRERLEKGDMTLGELLDVAAQVASALAAAHEAGIVHRDIKPENIMLRRDGFVKVLDFGLAKLASQNGATIASHASQKVTLKTDPGMVMGTVQYMSPEQARGEDVDTRTDIWSLGVVLYEMVTGVVPFTGETSSHVAVSILENEPAPLRSYSDVPAQLDWIISKALSKDKAERYQTAGDLALDLKNLKQELEVQARLRRALDPDVSALVSSGGRWEGARTTAAQGRVPSTHPPHPASSAEYLIGQIKQHRRPALLVTAAMLIGLIATGYNLNRPRAPIPSSEGEITSIAVLPFINASGDPDTEYLSDGLSESLINSLSQLPELKVTARRSSFRYRGKDVDPQEAAKALGVQAIVTGRIVERGEDLQISVELVDARNATHVWGEQYNRKAKDLLAVQVEISEEIARKLHLRLSAGEQTQLGKRQTVNPVAYELLLKGRFYRNKGATEDAKKALDYFNQAVAVDPAYALAYAELSRTYNTLVNSNVLDPKEFTPKEEDAARKSLELDDGLAEAHLAMARVKSNVWDWVAVERGIKRAIELNPSLASAHIDYTFFLIIHGRNEQALAEARRARELDPLSHGANRVVVYGLLLASQHVEAVEAANRMLEMDPNNPTLHSLRAQIYTRMGERRQAVASWQEAIRLGDDSRDAQIFLGTAYAKVGETGKTRMILRRLEKGKEYVSPVGLAMLHVALGEHEQALALLEDAFAAHDQQLIWLGVEPGFDPLRSDPRFEELLKRVGLKHAAV